VLILTWRNRVEASHKKRFKCRDLDRALPRIIESWFHGVAPNTIPSTFLLTLSFFHIWMRNRGEARRVIRHGYTPLTDIRRETFYPTSRRSIVALSSRLRRDITAFHCIYAATWETRTDGRTETRTRGFILRRRKRENHIDARNDEQECRRSSRSIRHFVFFISHLRMHFAFFDNFLQTCTHW